MFTPRSTSLRDYQKEAMEALQNTQNAFVALKKHVYSLEPEIGGRFLYRKATLNYSYEIGSSDLKQTKEIDILTHSQEYQYMSDRILDLINSPAGGLKRFESPYFVQLYDILSRAYSAVVVQTVVYIIDTDNIGYREVISSTYLIILLAILACFILGNVIIFLIWRVRGKILQVYKVVEILLPYEVELALDRLRQAKRLISLGLNEQLVSRK